MTETVSVNEYPSLSAAEVRVPAWTGWNYVFGCRDCWQSGDLTPQSAREYVPQSLGAQSLLAHYLQQGFTARKAVEVVNKLCVEPQTGGVVHED